MYLVLEYCGGGDLGQYLRRYSRMSEDIARYFLLQLAEGMKEMRVHNLIHVSDVWAPGQYISSQGPAS